MSLPPEELARRISAGGSLGGHRSALVQKARRRRYLDGEMDSDELSKYEEILVKRRRAASIGGTVAAKRHKEVHDGQGV